MPDKVSTVLMQGEQNKLTPKEVAVKYLIYLPVFVFSVVLLCVAAYLYIRYKTPVYQSSIQVLIKNDDKNNTRSSDLSLEDFGIINKKANLANEIEILKSVSLMKRVVVNNQLNVQYFNKGSIRMSEMFDVNTLPIKLVVSAIADSSKTYLFEVYKQDGKYKIYSKNTNAFYTSGQSINAGGFIGKVEILDYDQLIPNYKYIIKWQNPTSIAVGLTSKLSVRQINRDASILKLDLTTSIPQKGEFVLNEFVKAYNQANLEDKNTIVENTLQFIDSRLQVLTSELGTVEQGLKDYRQKNEIINLEKQGEAQFGDIETIKNKLFDGERHIYIIDELKKYLSQPDKKFKIVPSNLGIEDLTLIKLISGYNELILSRFQSLETIPEANPSIQAMNNQLDGMRQRILENLNNIYNTYNNTVETYKKQYYNLVGQIQGIPQKQKDVLEIMRQQGIKEKLFLYLLQKREESAITKASTVGAAKALDPAATDQAAVTPDKTSVYRIAIFIGLILPIIGIYVRDILNDKIITRNDITKATMAPLLGEISHLHSGERELIITGKDRTVLAEQFRVVRTNLQFLNKNAEKPVLLVTSTVPGEGKTFCSMNLAAVWSVANKKTVILELDLRKPKISQSLNLVNAKGVSNYVLNQATVDELPVPISNLPNLFIVPSGPIPPNPSEILMDKKMDELIAYLKTKFDFIIIDSAPIGLVSDAKLLSRFADSTIYIIRQRYTVKKQLQSIDEIYKNDTLPNLGIVVNDVKITGANSYYGYGVNYGYNYNYQYGQEDQRSRFKKIKDFFGI